MASPEKMFKTALEEIHTGTEALVHIIQNQELIIRQNDRLIKLLEKIQWHLIRDAEDQ